MGIIGGSSTWHACTFDDAVHVYHCCKCNCKYGDSECPVVEGRLKGIQCEDCRNSNETLRKIERLMDESRDMALAYLKTQSPIVQEQFLLHVKSEHAGLSKFYPSSTKDVPEEEEI